MNRLLLSLWLLGAALYAGNTLLYTNAIFGWPNQKIETDAHRETATTSTVAKMQDRQPAEIAESESPAAPSQPTAEPSPAPAAQLQSKHAPGLDNTASAPLRNGAATAPLPTMPQAQSAPGMSAQQQIQPTPPTQRDGGVSSSQADATPSASGDASSSQAEANWASPAQQTRSTAQSGSEQTPQATQSVAAEQSGGEWVKSRGGATVRSGPSSSASELTNLRSGVEVRVIARESGWVQIANADGSKTGWVYEKLLEPTTAPREQSAEASGATQANSGQQHSQSGWVKVLGSPAGMRSTPSQSAPVLFAFPEGRELRVVSRQPGWVQVTDPGSKQSGWVAETSLITSNGQAKQQQVSDAPPHRQQAAPARSHRQQASSAPPQRRQPNPPPQRPSRDAGPESYDSAEGPPPPPRGGWVPWDPDMGPPAVAENPEDRPRRWWRRRGGSVFFRGGGRNDE